MAPPRWHLRFDQYRRALALFKAIEAERRERPLSDAERAGLVQFFNLTVELGWKSLGAFLQSQGVDVATMPVRVIRAAMSADLIADGDGWTGAVERRNLMAHVYDVAAFDDLVATAGQRYGALFDALEARLVEERAAP